VRLPNKHIRRVSSSNSIMALSETEIIKAVRDFVLKAKANNKLRYVTFCLSLIIQPFRILFPARRHLASFESKSKSIYH
jgi:signal recognition particle subunit SEC65